MRSEKQIQINRLNAHKSTWPKSPAGKARSALNALKSGFLTRDVLMPGEKAKELIRFREGMMAQLDPQGEFEEFLADRVVESAWRLRRAGRMERQMVDDKLSGELRSRARDPVYYVGRPLPTPDSVAASLLSDKDSYDKMVRYEAHIQRGFCKAFQALERRQAERKGGPMTNDEFRMTNARKEKGQDGEVDSAKRSQTGTDVLAGQPTGGEMANGQGEEQVRKVQDDSAKRSQFEADDPSKRSQIGHGALVVRETTESSGFGRAPEKADLESAVSEENGRTCERGGPEKDIGDGRKVDAGPPEQDVEPQISNSEFNFAKRSQFGESTGVQEIRDFPRSGVVDEACRGGGKG